MLWKDNGAITFVLLVLLTVRKKKINDQLATTTYLAKVFAVP